LIRIIVSRFAKNSIKKEKSGRVRVVVYRLQVKRQLF